MANPEHLKILKQGVEAWNKWREENPCIQPDLSKANLKWADLSGADLSEADLRKANISDAILCEVNLKRANLISADISGTDLSGSDLRNAQLIGVKAIRTKLIAANLTATNLTRSFLRVADLFGALMRRSNLMDADMSHCSIVDADLSSSVLTGTKLYGTARDDWIIKDIKCKYVYWDEVGKQRSPKDRDLEPGEFERLYSALPSIEYIFENGMSPIDPLIMDRVVQAIRERQPEFDIKIDSINARGLAPSIKFTVQQEEHKEPALQQVQKEYEIKLKQLESERDRYYQLLARALDAPKEVKLITAGPGAIVATDGSTVNIQQHINYALELQKAIANKTEESKSFAKVAKKTALDIIGEAIKDIAKGQIKEAAKQIVELGKDLGPIIAKTAAYAFFKSIGG